jgi:hypothetical protein
LFLILFSAGHFSKRFIFLKEEYLIMSKLKKYGNRVVAALLLTAMTMSSFSFEVSASTSKPESTDYFYLDGERISADDERVINIVPVRKNNPLLREASAPPITEIAAINNAYVPDATTSLQGNLVHAIRYVARTSDGMEYEVFCADPLRKGPETAGEGDDDYRVLGEAAIWLNALKYGYPANPNISAYEMPENERMNNAYLTRVAVAMGRNPAGNFSGDSALIAKANQLATQGGPAELQNYDDAFPAITINGNRDEVKTVSASGDTAASGTFEVAYTRRTNRMDNPFIFEWDAGTPAGAELWVDGTLVATAPANVDTLFSSDNLSGFELKMPNSPEYKETVAKVNLIGVHNEWADKVWVLRHSTHSSPTVTEAPVTGQRQD